MRERESARGTEMGSYSAVKIEWISHLWFCAQEDEDNILICDDLA